MAQDLEKRASTIHGYGMFAKTRILQGPLYEVPIAALSAEPKKRYARIGSGRYVDDDLVLNWVNHSCSPNARLDIAQERPLLLALRDIAQNEEITVDYDLTEEHAARVPCACQAPACRGAFYRSH